jgi:hypothetical protein
VGMTVPSTFRSGVGADVQIGACPGYLGLTETRVVGDAARVWSRDSSLPGCDPAVGPVWSTVGDERGEETAYIPRVQCTALARPTARDLCFCEIN